MIPRSCQTAVDKNDHRSPISDIVDSILVDAFFFAKNFKFALVCQVQSKVGYCLVCPVFETASGKLVDERFDRVVAKIQV